MDEGKMRKKLPMCVCIGLLSFQGCRSKRLKEEEVDKREGRSFSKILKRFDSFDLKTV